MDIFSHFCQNIKRNMYTRGFLMSSYIKHGPTLTTNTDFIFFIYLKFKNNEHKHILREKLTLHHHEFVLSVEKEYIMRNCYTEIILKNKSCKYCQLI